MTQEACQDYFKKFPSKLQNDHQINNEDRIKFMLTNPVIRTKLDEWLLIGNMDGSTTDAATAEEVKMNDKYLNIHLAASQIKNKKKASKSNELSLKRRKEGNTFYQKQMLEQSLICYQDAIRHSQFTPQEKENAAICLANRSAVYFELGKYNYSLRDADLALANKYPQHLEIKLILRKANIFLKMNNLEMAIQMVNKGKEIIENSNPSDNATLNIIEKLNKIENEITIAMDQKNRKDNDNVGSNLCQGLKVSETKIKHKVFEDNPLFESASIALKIEFVEEMTRFINCCENVSIGDIIFQENPFASVLIPEFYDGYCNYCHIDLNGYFFPCSHCIEVSYCSASCSTKAWKQYHRYECHSLYLLHSVGIGHLAVRIVLITGVQEILKTLMMEKQLNNYQNFKVFQRGESHYKRVFSLMSHIGDMNPEDLFQYCLTASLLTLFIKERTNFVKGLSDDEIAKIGGVILQHICQLICNAHAVTSILTDLNVEHVSYSTLEETQVKIATAIYPAVSLTNHSCDPNIACSFKNGRTLIVKAATNLEKGSEILNCYGPNFRRISRETRQVNLKEQYFFDCNCFPCRKELEENSNFVDKFHAYSCVECNGPVLSGRGNTPSPSLGECTQCHCSQNLKKTVKSVLLSDDFYSKGMDFLENGQADDSIKNLLKCYSLRLEALFKFNSDLGEVCDALGRCYAIIGDFAKSCEFVKKSLTHVEARFGISSVEYAREIIKYSEVLNNVEGMANVEDFPSEDLIQQSKFILGLYTP